MTPELIAESVAAFLREIVGDSTPEELAREEERWAETGDFNESWIATIRCQASDLLRLIDGSGHEPDNPQGVWCCHRHQREFQARRVQHSDGYGGAT